MRLTVIAVGTKMPVWVEQGVAEYSRRLPREFNLSWRAIPLASRGADAGSDQLRTREAERIRRAIPAGDRVVALDMGGTRQSTEALARELTRWQMSGDNYSLLIGGPDGLCPQLLREADARWSLSDLTLPHPLVRILLTEQLYRAWTITVNHPYHRA